MQVGLMAPQGWKGEYDGWDPAEAWARTVELATQAEELYSAAAQRGLGNLDFAAVNEVTEQL